MIVKIFNLKKGEQGLKVKSMQTSWRSKSTETSQRLKIWKQVKDGAQRIIIIRITKINSKTFAIPILTASGL